MRRKNMGILPQELRKVYSRGGNISEHLERRLRIERSDESVIELSYDIQAGSYTRAMEDPRYRSEKEGYCRYVSDLIRSLGKSRTVLEAGVGEATTFSGVARSLARDVDRFYGFDLSWSRAAYARRYLEKTGVRGAVIFTAALTNIPLADDSIDVVYTSHSIEPNRGREKDIIGELHRVARRYLVLIEPAYELAPPSIRRRLDRHRYCRGLLDCCRKLGCKVESSGLIPVKVTHRNLTAVTVISKNPRSSGALARKDPFRCPKYFTPLRKAGTAMFSDESMMAYPIIGGIPCLKVHYGVIASKLGEFE